MYVLKELFDRNAHLLLNNELNFKIDKDPSIFRSPKHLVNGYYIESNIDSHNKFRILSRILNLFDIDNLYVKLVPYDETETSDRFIIRKTFWKELLPQISNTNLFSNVSPSKEYWLNSGSGISGIPYTLLITKKNVQYNLQ